jgi:hypothetical protein
MGSVLNWILLGLIFSGAVYFWQKAVTLGLSWTEIIFCYLIFPAAVIRGLYFLARDLYLYVKSK